MAAPLLWGSEIFVNGNVEGHQANVKSVALKDGSYFTVWYDGSPNADNSEGGIHGQFFNADGTKRGAELLIISTTANDQSAPVVTVLHDGRIVVAWRSDNNMDPNAWDYQTRARILNPDGSFAGNDFQVSSSTNDTLPDSITALDGRGFVIAYSDGGEVRGQAFNVFGDRIGGEVLLNATTTGLQTYPTVVGLKNGNYIAFYTDESQTGDDTSGFGIRARIFTADGQEVVSEFLVNTGTKGGQGVTSATLLANGRVVVLWISEDGGTGDGDGACIKGQILNPDGTKYRGEFLVNTTTRGEQRWPSVTALADGGFAVAFMDVKALNGEPNTLTVAVDSDIRVVTFSSTGQLRSDDAVATATTAGLQEYPSLIELSDGRLVVSGTDRADSAADMDVHAQILDPRSHAVTFGGTAANDQYIGTSFGDTLSGGAGTDWLQGGAGDDVLDGGVGADRLDGGAGFDTVSYAAFGPVNVNLVTGANSDGDILIGIEGVSGSAFADTLTGSTGHVLQGAGGNDIYQVSGSANVIETVGQGYDTVIASGSYSLFLSAEVEVLCFDNADSTASYTLGGSDTANRISGNKGANLILGWGGDDTLIGDLGNDTLYGGAGNDTIWGGAGKDSLKGEAGKDVFVFDTRSNKSTNLDKILDFSVKDDSIWLDNKVFSKLGKKGTEAKPAQLSKSFFTIGTKAKDKNDYIVYDNKKGVLYYDADGSGKGKAMEIATLSKKLAMTYKDLFVI